MKLKIEGIDQLFRKLDALAAIRTLRPSMVRSVARLHNRMAQYPPQRAGSKYVRTGTLGRRWVIKIDEAGDGLIGSVGNNTEYAPLVQSRQLQSAIHRGRWQTDADVMQSEIPAIVADFKRAIDSALRG